MHKLIYTYSVLNKLLLVFLHYSLPKKGFFSRKIKEKIENFLFFSPRIKKIYPLRQELIGKFEPVRLLTKDCVKIYSWFIKPKENKPIVLFCHGQSENILKWQEAAIFLENLGYGALFLSYRGHYKSAGKPSEKGIYQDALTAIDFLLGRGYSTKNMIVWGRSLGSSIACEMALKHDLKAIILESAILDIKSAAVSITNWYVAQLNLPFLNKTIEESINKISFNQKFANNKKIQNVTCPILILHSKQDSKINYQSALGLYDLNKNANLYLSEEGSHDDMNWGLNKISEFLNNLNYEEQKLNI